MKNLNVPLSTIKYGNFHIFVKLQIIVVASLPSSGKRKINLLARNNARIDGRKEE